jgi:EAL domain-containing protein (putative c-di-GMP-specific phosphodiesterase class I)
MSENQEIKSQRDRFLAFSFASSDLFIEVSIDGSILYALGATKGMTGFDETEIIGKKWLNLFSVYDQAQVIHLYETSKTGKRCGPLLVELNELVTKRKAVFTGIKMPGSNKFYITLAFGNLIMSKIAGALGPSGNKKALTREGFIEQAKDTLELARSLGQNVDMTLLDFSPTQEDRKRMGEKNWSALVSSMASFLQTQSADGQAAAEIADGRFSIIHNQDIDHEYLRKRMESIALENDPENQGVEILTKTLSSDLTNLSDRDAARALVYTINEFERNGTSLTIENLNSGFKAFAETNAQKIKEFKALIERLDFSLFFQPIVNLKTMEVSHYEMLSRFKTGDTLEWVMFGEDIGMAPEFDIAVIERAINHINFKAGASRTKFSVNISGQSIEDETFLQKLEEKLAKNKDIKERLQFEITESSHITDLDKVNDFIEKLQKDGFKVALDDFGAGATSFQYLQKLKVDCVKIDGKYIRKLLSSQRDAAMVKNLTQMCKDLGISVVAEYVEETAQCDILKELGVDYGQGYLFGKPESAPSFTPPRK